MAWQSFTMFDGRRDRTKIYPDLQDLAHRIHTEFDQQLDPLAVEECLTRVAASFDDARIRTFVPLLVRRYVTDELHGRLASTA